MTDTVWIVQEFDIYDAEWSVILVSKTLSGARRATEKHLGLDTNLVWENRNSIFDSQEYLVAYWKGSEYHVFEMDVEE